MIDGESVLARHEALCDHLNERDRRLHAASEAKVAGWGGIVAVSRATGIARSTIGRGLKDLASPEQLAPGRVRREGGGRKPLTEIDPTLLSDLERLVEPDCRGDPMSPLRWTCKSLRHLVEELGRLGHKISRTMVGELLKARGFSLHANRKTKEGGDHPDRDAQFAVINQATREALAEQRPAISVDTKKKELVGDFKNAGREWRPKGDFEHVRVYDFIIAELGRAVPYGVYDLAANEGWVSVASTTTPPLSPCKPSADGGPRSASSNTRTSNAWSSPPTAAVRTVHACACGSSNCSASPTNSASRLRSIISRREQASGTRSSTACSRSSP